MVTNTSAFQADIFWWYRIHQPERLMYSIPSETVVRLTTVFDQPAGYLFISVYAILLDNT